MSEIPKLKLCESVFVENIGNKDEINFVVNNHNKEDIITLSSLKEVNTFYDKYKNNMGLFIKDFPEFKTYWEHREKSLSLCCMQEYLYIELFKDFKDWLHDYLYKVE